MWPIYCVCTVYIDYKIVPIVCVCFIDFCLLNLDIRVSVNIYKKRIPKVSQKYQKNIKKVSQKYPTSIKNIPKKYFKSKYLKNVSRELKRILEKKMEFTL